VETTLQVLGYVLLVLGGALALLQFGYVVVAIGRRVARGRDAKRDDTPARGVSFIPFGGLIALAGCSLTIGWEWGLIAVAIDPGCWFVIALPVSWIAGKLRRS
jgi:hypothetical protein